MLKQGKFTILVNTGFNIFLKFAFVIILENNIPESNLLSSMNFCDSKLQ